MNDFPQTNLNKTSENGKRPALSTKRPDILNIWQ